ncbi:response regulator [Psychroflexus montanilacus]|uniref:response regulator n=1 Tax=Psychroflexus montanilacus TaxID=2873598 RepID=UPI001CCF259A|nr:response regulator [Psychroflexus montanilacus]MBZ9651663.1 response regulator [Psychroflexus montanilacus]
MQPFKILLVEDNKGDVLMLSEAFETSNLKYQLMVASDGKAAMDHLFKKSLFETEVTPDLILLDLNLPKFSGLEVLKTIKNHNDLRIIPVLIFTTSSLDTDVNACYLNYANSYITKPQDALGYTKAVSKIEDFWMKYANLPSLPLS